MIYLDTHVLIWLYKGTPDIFKATAKALIDQNDLLFSPAISLEIQFLYESGKINAPPNKITDALSESVGLSLCGKPFRQIIRKASEFSWTRDPFDRMITAHAALDQSVLITKDKHILTHYKQAVW